MNLLSIERGEREERGERASSPPPAAAHVRTAAPSGDALGRKESFAPTKEEGQDRRAPANPRHGLRFKEQLSAVETRTRSQARRRPPLPRPLFHPKPNCQ